MSLTTFIQQPTVKDKIKPLRPPPPRIIPSPLRVEPPRGQSSAEASIVGGAFDYLVRFELQQRAPHATARKWVAQTGADMLRSKSGIGARARRLVDDAQVAVTRHLTITDPDRAQLSALADHAIRLAKLDIVARAGKTPDFDGDASAGDVADLLAMLDIVPWDSLVGNDVLILNPTFGSSSGIMGGADGDLIAGDLLVDFKTTKKDDIVVTDVDQFLGYFLLSRHEQKTDPDFPNIRRIGLYYARRGYLWKHPVSKWTEHPGFPSVENWFFTTALSQREQRLPQLHARPSGSASCHPPPRPRARSRR